MTKQELDILSLCVAILECNDSLSFLEKVYGENAKPNENVINTFLRLAKEKLEQKIKLLENLKDEVATKNKK